MPRLTRAALAAPVAVLAGALGTVLPARAARAASPPPAPATVFCDGSGLASCFAVGLSAQSGRFDLWLQNLEGVRETRAGGFALNAVRVQRRNPVAGGQATEFMVFNGGCSRTVSSGAIQRAGCWSEDSYVEPPATLQTRRYAPSNVQGLVGCTAAMPGMAVGRTCLAEGLDGWLGMQAMAWLVTDPLTGARRDLGLDDVAIRVGNCAVLVGARSGLTPAETGAACTTYDYAAFVNVVPEPGTLALLGGAFAALGGATLVRRRRTSHGG
jgi:hypothetical protein